MSRLINLLFCKSIPVKALLLSFAIVLPYLGYAQNPVNTNQPVFNHAALCAKDLGKTAAFYSTVLQLKKNTPSL